MPVARDLQNLVADVSAAIAGKESWNRAELEVLRRKVAALAEDAGQDERAAFARRDAFDLLADGVDNHVADLAGLARRARAQAPAVAG